MTSSPIQEKSILDFYALILIPVAIFKRVRPSDNKSASLFDPSQNISISSTKSKWVMAIPFVILIPEKFPPTFAFAK